MQLVVDANPIISILVSPGKPIELMFLEELEFFAPSLLFEEIERNKMEIIKKSGLTEREFGKFISIIKQKIKIIPEEDFINFREKAIQVCPHEKDITYFALALHLKCPLWSNEKKLKQQNFVSIYATHELILLFNIN